MGQKSGISPVRAELTALKRDRIITAASDLFATQGYDNTRLDTVAEHLGVTKQFIYSEFNSKADLLSEICLRAVTSTLDATEGVDDMGGTVVDRLFAFIRIFATSVCTHRTDVAVFANEQKNLTEPDRKRLDIVRRELDNRIRSLLEEGIKEGIFAISQPRVAALTIQGMISWMYVWYRADGSLALDDLAKEMAHQVLAMVARKSVQPVT